MEARDLISGAFSSCDTEGMTLIADLDPPEVTSDTFRRNREGCEENICGCFGTCWSCPPAITDEAGALETVSSFTRCALISADICGEPTREAVEDTDRRLQDVCRSIALSLRKAGIGCLPLTGGKCLRCAECTYPDDPCRFPDEMVPSATGYGIRVLDYTEAMGLDQPEGVFRLYGFVLY